MAGPSVTVTTSVLFGVFVSHKSFIIGKRYRAKWEYSELLAEWASDHRLPEKVVDVLHQKMYDVQKEVVDEQWKSGLSFEANAAHFDAIEKSGTMVQNVVEDALEDDRIKIQPVVISKPGDRTQFAHLLHLSTKSATSPSAMSSPAGTDLPPGVRDRVKWFTCLGLNGPVVAGCHPLVARHATSPMNNLRAAIAAWDADKIEAFVDYLDLHAVSFDGGDPDEPCVLLWQHI